MILSFPELIDIVIMTFAVGYIFMESFGKFKQRDDYEPLTSNYQTGFDWDGLKFAAMVTAPAIILHELAHKFTALSFGMSATFQAAYTFLLIGIMLKLMRFGFIFFVPAYVSVAGMGTPMEFSLIALAGPLTNGILWLLTWAILKQKFVKRKYIPYLALTSRINMFLFIFNMIPIPGFDGYNFFSGLLKVFF